MISSTADGRLEAHEVPAMVAASVTSVNTVSVSPSFSSRRCAPQTAQ
jgi:hypothetical protein